MERNSRKLGKMIKALKTSLRDGRKADAEEGSPWRYCAVCAFTPELHRRFLGGRTLCFLYTDVCALWGSVTWDWRGNWKVDFTSGHLQQEGRVELLGLASSRGS